MTLPPKITLRNRYSGGAVFSYQPSEAEVSSNTAMLHTVAQALFEGVSLEAVDLSLANLTGLEAVGKNFAGANLHGAILVRANLSESNFSGGFLSSADLSEAILTGTNFESTYLDGADFARALVDGARFRGAYMRGASFEGTDLSGADLADAGLLGADFGIAQLRGAALGPGIVLMGEQPICSVNPLGSRRTHLTSYMTNAGVYLRTGCFFGTREQFLEDLEIKYPDVDDKFRKEYVAALAFLDSRNMLWA